MTDFIEKLLEVSDTNEPFKIILAKPKDKKDDLRNIHFRPIRLKDEVMWQATFRYKTNDKSKNYNLATVIAMVEDYLEERFFNADLLLKEQKISLIQSKKGKSKVIVKNEKHNIHVETHNHEKKRVIEESAPFLQLLGLSSMNGKVFAASQDKFKQINKYVEIVTGLIGDGKDVVDIVDMGSGKGYLTFALYEYLKNQSSHPINIKGVELRKELVEKCNKICDLMGIVDLRFDLGSIDNYNIKKADMIIALHACDIATDMAIAKGLEAEAKYIIVSPCCHKQIRRDMTETESALNPIIKYGIFKERQAEMITDAIRGLILESKGYSVKIFEFISSEHTGKNIMITAQYTGNKNLDALDKIKTLKNEFGIKKHFLEKKIRYM